MQADGNFNGGQILEKKPIPFPHESKGAKPYSNLFYWAHAWSEKGSTIGEHPHKGFEILSFVLKGDIEHYDSKNRKWMPLSEGGAQIIRSGNGISHAEKINAASEIFQIWFDPDLNKTLPQPATYDDYKSNDFPVSKAGGITTKTYKGEGAPIQMVSEGVVIKEISFGSGEHIIPTLKNVIYSIVVLDGNITINNDPAEKRTFIIIKEEERLTIKTDGAARLFVIETPLQLSYKTYADGY